MDLFYREILVFRSFSSVTHCCKKNIIYDPNFSFFTDFETCFNSSSVSKELIRTEPSRKFYC